MSRRRAYSPDAVAIIGRFFAAYDAALANGLIRTVSAFCDGNCIDKRHFYAQRKDPGRGYFEVGWLVPLVRDCGVSANWLLTGKGMMFVQ